MEQQLLIAGMTCAACVRRVEKALQSVTGVEYASINLADETAFVQGNVSPEALIQAVQRAGYDAEILESEEIRRLKHQAQTTRALLRKKWQAIVALSVGLSVMILGMFLGMMPTEENRMTWLIVGVVTLGVMIATGGSFFQGAWISLRNKSASMDTLVALSTGTAWIYSFCLLLSPRLHGELYFEASTFVIGFISLGKYLEIKTKRRSSLALEKLLDLAPKQVTILEKDSSVRIIPAKGIKIGMQVQVRTGDRLAVDGVLRNGTVWVDEAMLTGEALPQEKKEGDRLRAGTLVQDGAGVYEAQQVGSQTTLAQVINAVRHAQSSKPALAQLVDKVSAIFVPIVVLIAVTATTIWYGLGADLAFSLKIFTTVLIIACPCGLGLAIPLSTVAGVARSAEFGVLVRNMEALQTCSLVDTLVFDKTGTLTKGEMTVSEVSALEGFDEELLLSMAKSLERHATHPIAKAITQFATHAKDIDIQSVKVAKGLGISGIYQGEEVKIGNARYVSFLGIPSNTMATQVFVSVAGRVVGIFSVEDQLRPETKEVITAFQASGYDCYLLTGDRLSVAENLARQLGLKGVIAEVLPEEKAEKIQQLQTRGKLVAMIGDGINDAPALAQANVGIAMRNGADIAVETADISLMKQGLLPLMEILPFSKRVLRNMRESLFGAFIYNIIAIPIAAGVLYPYTGWLLNPAIASIAMMMSSITVVLNSQRLLR